MPLIRCLALALALGMAAATANSQAVFAPRAAAMGAYAPLVRDSRGFTANPAGLVGMRDWDFNTSTYMATTTGGADFVFGGFGMGKRFLENSAVAFQYTPGTSLDVIEPGTLFLANVNIPADKKISYSEPLAAAYAYRVADFLSVGVQGRMRTEEVTDPEYSYQLLKDTTTIVPVQQVFSVTTWFADLGLLWKPSDNLSLSAVGRSLLRFRSGELPAEFSSYVLPDKPSLELGAAYGLLPVVMVSAGASSLKRGAFGAEWTPGWNLAVRGGLYGDAAVAPFVYAFGAGIGWSFAFLEADASYLGFTNQANRRGRILTKSFDASGIVDLGMNPFATDRVALSIRAVLGNVHESVARIEGVEMFGGIYPSASQALAFNPLGKVRVRNTSRKPIEARATFFIDRLMDRPTETPPVHIGPGETVDIPFTAVFNDQVRSVPAVSIREGTVGVTAAVADQYDDRTQTRVLVHGKNDWDGSPFSLRYFVTPDDPEVLRTSREILLMNKDSLEKKPAELSAFFRARVLCNAFAGKLVYVRDPKQNGDYVQYPSETLKIRGGACDDMTVCFASLLSSVGISTAFVDVIPPAHPEKSHIYLLFDTGVAPKFGASVAANPKRYVIRKSKSGDETIWLPLETTVIGHGFDEAWTSGAQEYFDNVEIGLGLVKGWVRVVDVY